MNVQPNAAAASIAGTARAAARGGEADAKAADAASKQAITKQPAGKSSESSAIDAGEQTSDRGGDGRQMYDTFERSKDPPENEVSPDAVDEEGHDPPTPSPPHIDFNA
ncbi:hypothetical protein [Novipirellula artificiosorum]|uniref:Uncharacterized protein n=1 Tax=Novipirellula artificiosorum TaxID=2528016 RepID=A0A5C6DCA6_9BACT|nr:hypothetical protein [Novipirellula artificiosorum]TWU32856.1 hypothetical protein Poly41_52330 [Novipirellula artificiosorum]